MGVIVEHGRGTHLAWSLTRKTSGRFQIGCSLALALLLGGGGYAILRAAVAGRGTPNNFVTWVVGGGFALVGALLALAAIHQLFAMATPETRVEVDSLTLPRGAAVRFFFEQRGPASMESLRANLVGEATWWEGSGQKRTRHVEHLGTFNFFDSGAFVVENRSVPFTSDAVLHVPADILPTGRHGERAVSWTIEVWGKVKRRADFLHVFRVQVG